MENKTKDETMADSLDSFILRIGRLFCWANAILLVVIITQVILRYVFNHGLIMLEELEWHLYSVGFMVGFSYAMTTDSHVRIDLLYKGFSEKTQAWINLATILFLLFPFIGLMCWHSIYFISDSWVHSERSLNPMGLSCRWAIKAFIPIGFILLGISSLSSLIRAIQILKRKENGSY